MKGTTPRRRLSPVGVLGGLAAVVAMGAIVIAISSDGGDDSAQDSANAAERSETLVVGQFLPPAGRIANPYLKAGDNLLSDGVWELVFEPLFYFNYQTG